MLLAIIKNYLMGEKLPNYFNQTIAHFQIHKDCVLIFIRDTNLKSVSETLKGYKNKKFYKGEKISDIFIKSVKSLKAINCPSNLNASAIDEFLIILLKYIIILFIGIVWGRICDEKQKEKFLN